MRKHIIRAGLLSTAAALVVMGGTAVFAEPITSPAIRVPEHDTNTTTSTPNASSDGSGDSSTGDTPSSPTPKTGKDAELHSLTLPQQQTCQDRAKAINTILSRIDTRTQNQITFFDTVTTRVESFYTTKSKPVSNYDQLVAAIATAKAQAQTDLTTMQTNGTITCTGTDPKGMIETFQTSLKTEATDLSNYRTAIKNLIKAIAAANNVTVQDSSSTSTTGGQQ